MKYVQILRICICHFSMKGEIEKKQKEVLKTIFKIHSKESERWIKAQVSTFQTFQKASCIFINKLCCVPSLFQTVGLPRWIDYSPWPQEPQRLERHANRNNMHSPSIQLSSSSAHIPHPKFMASHRTCSP